ncbi:MAG: mannosyltransferase [Bacteroidota bacterium]
MNKLSKNKSVLLSIVIVSAVCYWLHFSDVYQRQDFWIFIANYSLLFGLFILMIKRAKNHFWSLVASGIFFRLLLLFFEPNLSQDFFRFVWDGRLIHEGFNPYLSTPQEWQAKAIFPVEEAEQLIAGMGELNASNFSNYPPLSQFSYYVAALISPQKYETAILIFKVILLLADIGILYFGRKILHHLKLSKHLILLYFLNPFIILEISGNLHFESLMLAFLAASFYFMITKKWIISAVLLGLSIATKLLPLLLLPIYVKWFLVQKEKTFSLSLKQFIHLSLFYGICLGSFLITFLPFAEASFIQNISTSIMLWFGTFEFNASIFYIIRWVGYQFVGWNIIAIYGKIMPILVLIGILMISFFRQNQHKEPFFESALFAVSLYFIFSTTVHPWYIATPLFISIFTRYRFAVWWSFLVMLSYSAYQNSDYQEDFWLIGLSYSALLFTFLLDRFQTSPLVEKN